MIPRELVHESLLSGAKPHRVDLPRDRVGAQRAPEQQDVRLRSKRTRTKTGEDVEQSVTGSAPRRCQTEGWRAMVVRERGDLVREGGKRRGSRDCHTALFYYALFYYNLIYCSQGSEAALKARRLPCGGRWPGWPSL